MKSAISLLAAANIVSASLYGESNLNHTCQLTNDFNILSCSAQANAMPPTVDTCCVETFGGLVLSTQFWDTYTGLESSGQLLPKDSWTLHGLWPDFCNGSYTGYCDASRQYDPTPNKYSENGTANVPYTGTPLDQIVFKKFGKYDLQNFMNTYWINQGAPNVNFWEHEFSKHATCYSTFDLPCYGPDYQQYEDVIQFWETAILYYRQLPTWDWLASSGIVPSNTTTYSLSAIQGTLTQKYGAVPYLGCTGPAYNSTPAGAGTLDNGRTVLDEVWYYQYVYGRPQEHRIKKVDATLPNTSCTNATGAIRYPLRTATSVNPNTPPKSNPPGTCPPKK